VRFLGGLPVSNSADAKDGAMSLSIGLRYCCEVDTACAIHDCACARRLARVGGRVVVKVACLFARLILVLRLLMFVLMIIVLRVI